MTQDVERLLEAAAALGLLVAPVSRLRLHAFPSLLLAAVILGLSSGMKAEPLPRALQTGVADVLGLVALVLGLGAMLGRLLTASGGAERIALTSAERWYQRSSGSGMNASLPARTNRGAVTERLSWQLTVLPRNNVFVP